jgi:hypothetical protein
MPTKTLPRGKTQANWIIKEVNKAWVEAEALKAGKRPAHVIDEIIEATRGDGDKHHQCASLEEARQKECEICLTRMP